MTQWVLLTLLPLASEVPFAPLDFDIVSMTIVAALWAWTGQRRSPA